ncbi:hypothetical protein MIND_01126800 [Mycena indigotica]|uniref:Uncharacterized protein n=1 Tax=Mycena indigotica TaxID=2126181 RepID=A0A8H6VTM8_9AGAR|nr:uncharacterized protein MIND_01126800 [Mycena indigotica]KAF7293489.1 hypothetical protein MIND_01126800 [Mycena indigotica]
MPALVMATQTKSLGRSFALIVGLCGSVRRSLLNWAEVGLMRLGPKRPATPRQPGLRYEPSSPKRSSITRLRPSRLKRNASHLKAARTPKRISWSTKSLRNALTYSHHLIYIDMSDSSWPDRCFVQNKECFDCPSPELCLCLSCALTMLSPRPCSYPLLRYKIGSPYRPPSHTMARIPNSTLVRKAAHKTPSHLPKQHTKPIPIYNKPNQDAIREMKRHWNRTRFLRLNSFSLRRANTPGQQGWQLADDVQIRDIDLTGIQEPVAVLDENNQLLVAAFPKGLTKKSADMLLHHIITLAYIIKEGHRWSDEAESVLIWNRALGKPFFKIVVTFLKTHRFYRDVASVSHRINAMINVVDPVAYRGLQELRTLSQAEQQLEHVVSTILSSWRVGK